MAIEYRQGNLLSSRAVAIVNPVNTRGVMGKGISPDLLERAPNIPWREIARMRDHLAHHYFDTDHAIVQDVVDTELAPLLDAVHTLIDREAGDAGT